MSRLEMVVRPRTLFASMAVATCIGLLIPAVLIGVLLNGAREAKAVSRHEEQALTSQLDALATSLPTLLWNEDAATAKPLLDAVLASAEVVRVTVIDRERDEIFVHAERPERRHAGSKTAERDLRRNDVVIGRVVMEVDDSLLAASLREQRLVYGLTLAAQGLLSLWLILWMLNSRVVGPVRRLAAFCSELAQGHFAMRLPPSRNDDEIGRLGQSLLYTRDNLQALFSKQQSLIEALERSESEVQRLSGFYAALCRTNQAISRIHDEQALLHEICVVCVDVGQVMMAAISGVEGRLSPPTTVVGLPADLLQASWPDRAGADELPLTRRALQDGRRAISDDVASEFPGSAAAALAERLGVRSVAAFALRRGAGVAGVLTLYAKPAGFFDAAAADLFDEMAVDLSDALDRIDGQAQRVAALHKAEAGLEMFSRLFHAAPVSMSIVSCLDGRIVDVNAAFCERWSVDRGDVVGRLDGEVGLGLVEADRARYDDLLAKEYRVRNFVGRARGAGGETRDVLVNGELIDYRGQLCAVTATLDLSEVREAEATREALRVAEASNRAKTEFISRMSHELRTPLNAVLGFAQLLRDQASGRLLDGELTQLGHIEEAGRHLLKLIDDVLDVARIESGRLGVELRSVDVAAALDAAMKMSEPVARDKDVALQRPSCPPGLAVTADPLRLQQVLINVISNAVKYNRPGGRVELAAQGDDAAVTIEISDTGVGMQPDQVKHLYEPFNRLGRERTQIEGTGIGLTLTRELVRLMGGRLEIASTHLVGTTVTIVLPGGGGREPSASTRQEPVETDEAAQAAGTVLYIEDNPVNVIVVTQMLSRLPRVTVLHADTGSTGLRLAASALPDLVLLDMQLPDMDGFAVLQGLRADPSTRAIPVVAVSASAMPEDAERARHSGMTDYWTKPLDLQSFVQGVACLLRKPGA